MMKRAVLLMVLLLATSAFAGVTVECNQVRYENVVEVTYEMDGGDANLPRAFSLDISVDNGATIGPIYNFDPNYYVAPGTYDYNESTGDVCDWGNPVVNATASSFTCEMGSLYAAGDPYGHTVAPPSSGTLFRFTVSGDCNVVIEENAARAGADSNGVVMEDTEKSFAASYVTISECQFVMPPPYPPCWDYLSQCYGDADNTASVSIGDLGQFTDAWGKNYASHPPYHMWDPDPPRLGKYNPCADFDHNGAISIGDLGLFTGHWGWSVDNANPAMELPVDCKTTVHPDPLSEWQIVTGG